MTKISSDRRKWRCPMCGKTYLIRMDADDPMVCRACREPSVSHSSGSPKHANKPSAESPDMAPPDSRKTVDASRSHGNTRKFFLIGLIAVFLAAALVQVARQKWGKTLAAADVYKEAVPSVVVVKGMRFEDGLVLGQGSGFIVEPGDIIVTNEHVIRGAPAVSVETHDGRTARIFSVLAVDSQRDIAILPVPESIRGIPGLKMAATLPNVGEPVFAIGAPLGLDATFTQGVVSQVRNEFLEHGRVIQTDASVGPGSSGGPLVNGRVEIVGVNTMVASPESKAQNVNFAVASSEVASLDRAIQPTKLTDLPGYREPTFEELFPALVEFGKIFDEAARQRQLEQEKAARLAQIGEERRRQEQERVARVREEREREAGAREIERERVQREEKRRQQNLRMSWRQISRGMTREQVKAVLGEPDHISSAFYEDWTYKYRFEFQPKGLSIGRRYSLTGRVSFSHSIRRSEDRTPRVEKWEEPEWKISD